MVVSFSCNEHLLLNPLTNRTPNSSQCSRSTNNAEFTVSTLLSLALQTGCKFVLRGCWGEKAQIDHFYKDIKWES